MILAVREIQCNFQNTFRNIQPTKNTRQCEAFLYIFFKDFVNNNMTFITILQI